MRESLSRCDGIFTVFTRCSSSKKWWHENLSILYLSRLVGEGFRGNSKPKVALSGVHHNSRRVREKRDTTLGDKSVLNQLSSTSTLLHDVRARHKSKRATVLFLHFSAFYLDDGGHSSHFMTNKTAVRR